MGNPVYEGMPPSDRTFTVKKDQGGNWGTIRCGGACKDNYDRIVVYHQTSQRYIKLQKAAMESLRDAERELKDLIYVTGGWRSCALQAQLYRSDPNRFAPPNTTAHCRGLALDLDMNQRGLARKRKALLVREWYQARPDDEPWHVSMGLRV